MYSIHALSLGHVNIGMIEYEWVRQGGPEKGGVGYLPNMEAFCTGNELCVGTHMSQHQFWEECFRPHSCIAVSLSFSALFLAFSRQSELLSAGRMDYIMVLTLDSDEVSCDQLKQLCL